MRKAIYLLLVAVLMFSLAGCAQVKRKSQMTACPMPEKVATFDDGTIYRAGMLRPLFEDRHARNVGDELLINIGEESTVPEKTAANAEKPTAGKEKPKSGKDKPKTKAEAAPEARPGISTFSGKIIATVMVVLDNGNLLVCGDKLVKFANEDTNFTYVRFSGIINPQTISANNSVQSADVANIQLEHRNSNSIDPTPEPGFFNRLSSFFLPKKLYF